MGTQDEPTAGRRAAGTALSVLGITDEQAEANKVVAEFGTTIVTEGGQLARYVGRGLGAIPHDAFGIILGDPLHFVRGAIAKTYDVLLNQIFQDQGVTETRPVSPSVAIPLLRAAYDESRAELQRPWSGLIAAEMNPKRSERVRLSYIDVLKKFDPLDALVLKKRDDFMQDVHLNPRDFIANRLNRSSDEIQISVDNLIDLKCLDLISPPFNFIVTTRGKGPVLACSA